MSIFDFKPCKHGHTGVRNSAGRCVECVNKRKSAYQRTKGGKAVITRALTNRYNKMAAEDGVNPQKRHQIEELEEERRLAKELEL